ncbi:unnamed protein product [Periconia digitata]|uniref:Elongator complex protein 4 n=1 Tax=Periconia digitata TaxID=1303443 RepID=A0A9W4XHK3_9PLEO|nr:unnamed protein product [Periconia digitata]
MSFRKRNIALTRTPQSPSTSESTSTPSSPSSAAQQEPQHPSAPTPGVRPSPINGLPTTSTGTPSLDAILAGHAGLPLGTSLLLGETGTTDYAGALLRFYAAQGVVHGHCVHVVGVGSAWGRELPGIADGRGSEKGGSGGEKGGKMKIAYRYERLGVLGEERAGGRDRGSSSANRGDGGDDTAPAVFCHTFDLLKRLDLPVGTAINYIPIPRTTTSPFVAILQNLQRQLASSAPGTIHRLVVPSLLSPVLFPPQSSHPSAVLQFLHALRALLRQYPTRLTAMISLPLSLYPRATGLVRWAELLSDGVFELSPFAHSHLESLATSAGTTKDEEKPQGMFTVHKLPIFHEKGGGGGGAEGLGEDLAFTVSRRKFVIAKFSLPPLEGDTEAQAEAGRAAAGGETTMPKKADLEF